jgi:aspartyl aminopeptidase
MMSYIWLAMARKECQDAIETITENVKAFPELLIHQDEDIKEHLDKVCEALCVVITGEEEHGA